MKKYPDISNVGLSDLRQSGKRYFCKSRSISFSAKTWPWDIAEYTRSAVVLSLRSISMAVLHDHKSFGQYSLIQI